MELSSRSPITLSLTLDSFLLAIPDPATVFALDTGAVLAYNAPARKLFSPAQLSLSAFSMRTTEGVDALRQQLQQLRDSPLAPRKLPAFTEKLLSADNSQLIVESHLTLFPSEHEGRLVLCVSRPCPGPDEEALQLETRRKSAFYASLSRELRSPLTAILGYVDLVADPETASQDRSDYLKIVRRSGETLLSLIHDLTDLSLAEADSLTLENAPFSTGLVIAELLSHMRPRARERGLNLLARYTTSVPRKLHGDASRLRQIISALLSHCIDKASHGDVTLQVAIIGESDARKLSFDINAISPSSSESSLDLLFDALVANPSASKGTTLALPLARRLAHLMNGSIVARSLDNSRIGFRFTVPLSAMDLSDLLQIDFLDAAPVQPQPGTPQLLSGRVLLVEDSDDDRRLVQRILQRAGIDVSCLSDGTHALTVALHPFDAILMDLELPDLDGLDVTRRLRRRGETLPIIALTAAALPGDRERCLQAGCTAYLSKPIDKPSLLQTLSQLITKTQDLSKSETSIPSVKVSMHPLRSTREDDTVVRELLPKFVARLPRYVDEVHRLVRSLDAPAAERAAQSLAGTASNYGFESLSACASRIVSACRHEGCESEGARNALRTMDELIERITFAYPPRSSVPPPSSQ